MERIGVFAVLLVAVVGCQDKPAPTPPAPSSPAAVASPKSPTATPPVASSAPTVAVEAPSKIAAQHLLVAWKGAKAAPKAVTRTKDQARTRAQEAARKAKAGDDFSALVTEYSDDPTAKDRGNLGMFTRESKVKPFADAAFALPVNGVSDVVETEFGFHVIKRNQ